ncbi:hypothetical protein VTN02DRAFT_858 [Thermoascus thermophilus]
MMPPAQRPETLEPGSLTRSRSASMSSEFQFPKMSLNSPPPVSPEPAFIAASAASEIIAADQENNGVGLDTDQGATQVFGSTVVTPASLSLLNGFLDNLLFNILAAAKSTQLSSIRPAVADVLKPRLAKEVVSAADEELSECMGAGQDDEFENQEAQGEFDLIRSWKLARLRCMVYTRLGDMEEDEEDDYIEREGLDASEGGSRGFSSHVGTITPAVAIFLTSIIEYIAEQALLIAGETARGRLSAKMGSHREKQGESGVAQTCQLVVEDIDMEKLALNPTLGRLWRTWKKRVRSPALSRTLSRESLFRRAHTQGPINSRKNSINTLDEPLGRDAPAQRPAAEVQEQDDPASISFPASENDVTEIEVPGLAVDDEVETMTMEATVAQKVRPGSLILIASLPTPTASSAGSPNTAHSSGDSTFGSRHKRTKSLPSPTNPPHSASSSDDPDNNGALATPSEERTPLETMYEHDESGEPTTGGIGSSARNGGNAAERRDMMEPESQGQSESESNGDAARQADDASVSVPNSRPATMSVGARQGEQSVVLEGQGTRERPTLSSYAHRPPKKSSREASRGDSGSTYYHETSDAVRQPPHMQGTYSLHGPQDSTSTMSTINQEDLKKFPLPARSLARFTDYNIPSATSLKLQTEPLGAASREQVDTSEDAARRPRLTRRQDSQSSESIGAPDSASEDSDRSHGSRARSRSNPRTRNSGNQNRHEQASPVVPPEPERAAVQRVSGRSSISRDSGGSQPRRSLSISSGREKRPATAGSTTSHVSSKLKGLIGLQQGSGGNTRVRSSSEATGKKTIRYTLTPRLVREMDLPDSLRYVANRASTSELATFLNNAAPPEPKQQRPHSCGKVLKGVNGLRAHPPDSYSEIPPHYKQKAIEGQSAGAAAVQPSRPKSLYQARDARPVAGSTRDFAEFIRSTGPPPGSLQTHVSALQQRGIPGSPGGDAGPGTPSNVSRPSNTKSKDVVAKRNGPRLEARPAVTTKGDQTSDLIDFIREGPPVAGGHRIPRTVAPFRTTMDSDELQALGPPPVGKDAAPRDSISESAASKSVHSFNSGTGLLESTNRADNRAGPAVPPSAPPALSIFPGSSAPDDGMRPARKQRRVRDPYAIPDSEDEEDLDDLDELLDAPKGKPQREEESLIDFLRNAPPPPEMDTPPQPFSVNDPPRKTSSASSMKVRFLRSASLDKVPGSKPSKTSIRPRRNTGSRNSVSISTPSSPAVASGASTFGENASTGQSNSSSKVGLEKGGEQPSPISPRETSVVPITQRRTHTSDLADFLRNTGPPEPPVPRKSSTAGDEKDSSGTLSKLFVRRKKAEV